MPAVVRTLLEGPARTQNHQTDKPIQNVDSPDRQKFDETELVRLLCNGSDIAFAHLYSEHSGALFSVILRTVDDKEEAADILQDAFTKIYRGIGAYDANKGRLAPWMVAIAQNLSIDRLRSSDYRNVRKKVDVSLALDVSSLHIPPSADHMDLRKLFGRLRPGHWELIELNYYKGYTHEEIARMLGVPLGTVKTRIRAALLHLRALMEK